jgi:hypothetical protein
MPFFESWSYRRKQWPNQINTIHRIIQTVPVPITVSTGIADRIRRGPTTCIGIVITPTEPDKAQIPVMQAARKTKRNTQSRGGVLIVFILSLKNGHKARPLV